MSPILFYTPGSCAFGSIVTLEWLGKPDQLCRVEAEQRGLPSHKAFNLLGEVPVLLTKGYVLTQSFAILHHLASRDLPRRLVPAQGTTEFDQLNQVLAYLMTAFHPGFGPIFHTERFADSAAVQEVVRGKAIANLSARYAWLEAVLGNRDWFAGEQKTIVDAYFYGVVRAGDAFLDVSA